RHRHCLHRERRSPDRGLDRRRIRDSYLYRCPECHANREVPGGAPAWHDCRSRERQRRRPARERQDRESTMTSTPTFRPASPSTEWKGEDLLGALTFATKWLDHHREDRKSVVRERREDR